MNCQRCGKKEGEYFCSVCNRVICSNCEVASGGKIYCLDDAPKKTPSNVPQQVKPKESRILKDLIFTDIALLIGITIIFFISNSVISNMIASNFDTFIQNFPQLAFVFTFIQYFISASLFAIFGLIIILIILIAVFIKKKRRNKNI